MMISLNNKAREIEEGMTVARLVRDLHYRRASVWINNQQLLASEYETRLIKEGDQVKILRIVAGG